MYVSPLVLCYMLAIGCSAVAICIFTTMNNDSDDEPTEVTKGFPCVVLPFILHRWTIYYENCFQKK